MNVQEILLWRLPPQPKTVVRLADPTHRDGSYNTERVLEFGRNHVESLVTLTTAPHDFFATIGTSDSLPGSNLQMIFFHLFLNSTLIRLLHVLDN